MDQEDRRKIFVYIVFIRDKNQLLFIKQEKNC